MFEKLKEKLKSFLGKSKKEPLKEEKIVEAPKPKKEKPSEKPKKSTPEPPTESTPPPQEPTISEPKEIIEKPSPKVSEAIEKIQDEPPTSEPTDQVTNTSPKESDETTEEDRPIPKKPSFLSKFTKKLTTSTLTQNQVSEILEPLELILLENNVALEVVDKIKDNISQDLVGLEVKKSANIEQTITDSLKEAISSVLIEPPNLIEIIKNKLDTYVIIFFGINGSGKTTSVAKLASKLKKNNISCVLAAADTFRAASIEQLETHANRLKIPIIKSNYGSDPTAVAFDAKQYAEKNKIKCVLIDTAGRMYTKENLIKQMEKIIRVIKPDLKLFVGESITGNDVISQSQTFNESVGIDGIILTKSDVDNKGGSMLSASYVTKKPIYFLGTGQNYEDLERFNKQKILKNLGLE